MEDFQEKKVNQTNKHYLILLAKGDDIISQKPCQYHLGQNTGLWACGSMQVPKSFLEQVEYSVSWKVYQHPIFMS